MRSRLLPVAVAMLAAVACSKKKPEDPSVTVCKHVIAVCGPNANLEMCVASARAMRQLNPTGADEVDRCALSKSTCQEISMCTTKRKDKTVRSSMRRMEEAKKQVLEQAAEAASPDAAPASPPPTK